MFASLKLKSNRKFTRNVVIIAFAAILALALSLIVFGSRGGEKPVNTAAVIQKSEKDDVIKLTWLGCASFKIVCGEATFWTDPFITMSKDADHITTAETFDGIDNILISHGHFDHLMNVPEFSRTHDIRVYCSKVPRYTLLKQGVPDEQIMLSTPGDTFKIGDATIRVYDGEHNIPDWQMTMGAVLRTISSFRAIGDFFSIMTEHVRYPELDETTIFEINADGRRVLFMGSLGLRENAQQPKMGADLLILPYNGLSDPSEISLSIVEKLRPKALLIGHHDNAIPPLTTDLTQELDGFIEQMREKHPEIPVVVPEFGVELTISEIVK